MTIALPIIIRDVIERTFNKPPDIAAAGRST